MGNYYTKETLKLRVKQLSEAMGTKLTIVGNNGCFAVDGTPFAYIGWYHTAKDLILYIDGILDGIKFKSNQ